VATQAICTTVEGNVTNTRQANHRIVVVATVTTGCTDVGVVKGSRQPVGSVMAVFAGIAGRNMCRWVLGPQRTLACCRSSVVTGEACRHRQRVIKSG
jgi:hypothetical protein